MATYELNLLGLTRQLPIMRVASNLSIASFVMLGDTELVERCAEELVKSIPEGVEYLVCPEAKAIPLTHAMARILGLDYVVIRKSVKAYMGEHPMVESVRSITTSKEQVLVLDSADVEKIRGRSVAVVDDVVSTGGSLMAVESILRKINCKVLAKMAPLLEEGGHSGEGIIYIQKLPVFVDK